ncbi:hypothetical protein GCM10010266_53140 [Streptomyces griseomycini]|nr:hypothetical protein GCM10010266_53140 [Streptomyces griseomycini]
MRSALAAFLALLLPARGTRRAAPIPAPSPAPRRRLVVVTEWSDEPAETFAELYVRRYVLESKKGRAA